MIVFKNWLRRKKLKSLLIKLAAYNDKGSSWASHNELQIKETQDLIISEIEDLIDKIGKDKISAELLAAIADGSLKEDATGKHI